jgi:hypothetical protein
VSGNNVLQLTAVDCIQQIGSLSVIEMSIAASNPVLQRRRIRTFCKHGSIVIALEYQRLATGQHGLDMGRRSTAISQHPQTSDTVAKYKLRGLRCVMRHRKRLDAQVSDRKRCVAVNQDCPHVSAIVDSPVGAVRQVHREAMPSSEAEYTAQVIVMFVGNENRKQIMRGQAETFKAAPCFGYAESAVEKNARRSRFDNEAIALASAAKRSKPHPSVPEPANATARKAD